MRSLWILAALAALPHDADAFIGCTLDTGFSLRDGATVPPHARITYYTSPGWTTRDTPIATIDGKPVAVKVTWEPLAPYAVATFAIDSDRTGALVVGWKDTVAHYTVVAAPPPGEAHGTWTHFREERRHSTVTEVREGLQIAVDVPTTRFHARLRRDAKSPWQDLALAAQTIDGASVARIGDWSCGKNYSVPLLATGIDLELTAELADGTKLPVKGLPAHVVLAPQPPPPTPPTPPRKP